MTKPILTLLISVGILLPQLANAYTVEELSKNQYNRELNLPIGEYSTVVKMVDNMKSMDKKHLKSLLTKEDVSLYEASYGLYFLALQYLKEGDVEHGVKLLHVSAEDYLNPIALSEMARILLPWR